MKTHQPKNTKRRPVNLSIPADVLQDAKALNLNASQAAEDGIRRAIKTARETAWLAEHKDAIAAYNEHIEREGLWIKPSWMDD